MFTTDECRRKAKGDGLGSAQMNETTSTPLQPCLLGSDRVFCILHRGDDLSRFLWF